MSEWRSLDIAELASDTHNEQERHDFWWERFCGAPAITMLISVILVVWVVLNMKTSTSPENPALLHVRVGDWKQRECDKLFDLIRKRGEDGAPHPVAQQLASGFMFCIAVDLNPSQLEHEQQPQDSWILDLGMTVQPRFDPPKIPLFEPGIMDRYQQLLGFMHLVAHSLMGSDEVNTLSNPYAFVITSLHDFPGLSLDAHSILHAHNSAVVSWNVAKSVANLTILIPDYYFIRSAGYYEDSISHSIFAQLQHNQSHSFAHKINRAVWRGSSTGFEQLTHQNWRKLPRVRLCEASTRFPKLLDAKLTSVVQCRDEDVREEIFSSFLMGQSLDSREMYAHKALIDIDGNANSWSGCFTKLRDSRSVVIKIDSPFVQWYYPLLKPWEHFVPAKADLSDLESTIATVVDPANSEQMEKIGSAAHKLLSQITSQSEHRRVAGELFRYLRSRA